MSKESFFIIYDGKALETHEMEVRDLAPSLLALGDLLEEVNHVLNNKDAKISLKVNASFKSGSFGVDLDTVVSWATQARMLFSADTLATSREILEWIGLIAGGAAASKAGCISLLAFMKWLKGRKIKEVVLLDNGRFRVSVDDDAIEVERQVIEVYRNWRVRNAIQELLKPLEKDGIEYFATSQSSKSQEFVEVTKEEYQYFVAPKQEDELIDDRDDTVNLQLVNVAFRDDNKWRFSAGNGPFYAMVSDTDFLNRVQTNEISFSKGDILRVVLKTKQWLVGDEIKSEYEVLKVLEHRAGSTQLKLPFRDERSAPYGEGQSEGTIEF